MIRALLKSEDTFATPVVLYLVSELGMDALTFEPETIGEKLKAIEPDVHPALIDRVNAALGLYASDLFWTDPIVFGVVCRSLNRHRFPAGDEPDLGDLAWGVTEAGLLTRDVIDDEPMDQFSQSIIAYVKYTFKLNAVYTMPKALSDSFGRIEHILAVDDPAIAEARQSESDTAASEIDALVADKMYTLLLQVKRISSVLSEDAAKEVDQLLQEYQK